VVFSPDGEYLFSGGEEQEITCWDLRSMRAAFNIPLQTNRLQFSSDGGRCAVVGRTAIAFHVFERTLPCRELAVDLGGDASQGVISANGRWLAVSGGSHRLALWDLTGDGRGTIVTAQPTSITPLFSPDSSELLASWDDGLARWRLPAVCGPSPLELVAEPIHKPGRILSAGFSGDRLVLGTPDGAVVVPSTAIATGPGELFPIGLAQGRIAPNGAWIAVRKTEPHREEVYRLEPWKGLKFVHADAEVLAEAFAPGSDELAVATFTSVSFLDPELWEPRRRFPIALDRNARIIYMPDGGAFWLVQDARSAVLRDARTFEALLPLPAGSIPLAVSPDGRRLVLRVDDGRIQEWDLEKVRAGLRELGLDWRQVCE
jgi:WD40 repeat protein